jgi:hypothetical protein
MAPVRRPCSDTTKTIEKPSVELLSQWVKTMATDFFEVMVRGSDEVDGREDGEDIGNVGITSERAENDLKKKNNSINMTCNMFCDIYFLSHACSKSMKLIGKITLSLWAHFLMWGRHTFQIVFH